MRQLDVVEGWESRKMHFSLVGTWSHFVGGFLATSGTVAVQRSVIPVAKYYAVYRRNEKVIQAFHSQSQMEV